MKTKKNHLIESAVCTAIATTVLAIAVACGGGNMSTIMNPNPGGSGNVARAATHPSGHSAVYAPVSKAGAFIAAFFQSPSPTPTPVPSQLPESFEGTCDLTGVPSSVLSQGFVILNVASGQPCGPQVGVVENISNLPGAPVAFAGTITLLKVNVITVAGQRLRCIVTNGDAPVNDNDGVQPYYNVTTNTAVLGVGTNQLPVSCVVPVPAGDQAEKITIDWSKI